MSTNGHSSNKGYSNIFNNNKRLSGSNKPEELFDFKWIYSILKRYIALILGCMVIVTAAAYYIAYEYMLPVYESNATLYIGGANQTFPGGGNVSKIISASYNLGTTVKTEIHFLKSRELSLEVAKQVSEAKYLPNGTIYPVLWKSYPEDSTIVSVETVASRIRGGLTVEAIEMGSNILSVSYESYSPYAAARVINFTLNAYQEITAYKKRASARDALQFIKEEKQRIKSKLESAENSLSAFMSNEGVVQIDAQTSNQVNLLTSLQMKKQQILIELKAVEEGIKNYKNQLEAIKPGLGEKYAQAVGPTISAYQKKLAQLQMKRFSFISNNPELKENPNSEPAFQRVNKKIANLQNQIKHLTNEMLKNNKNYLGLLAETGNTVTKEISLIKQNLTQLNIKRNQYKAQLQAINRRLQNNRSFLDQVPQNKIQLARLKRQVKIYEQIYLNLTAQANEVSLWKQTQNGSGTVIDYARVSKVPIKPRKFLWLGFGLFLGFMVPFGLLMTKESLNNKITSIQALKEKSYPLLAVIYNHDGLDKKKQSKISQASNKNKKISKELITYHYGLSPIAESYRNLVSNILYSHPDSPPNKLLITSAGEGEGKTTLSANMAVSLVEMGHKVLIIDCDMRKSGLPKFFGCKRHPGLLELLFKNKTTHDVIRATSIDGLDLLLSGKEKPSQPASVLSSNAFKELIIRLELDYDFILFDTAPFGIISDAAPLLQITDGVILSSKFAATRTIELDHTLDKLENNSANIFGLVLNMYDSTKSLDEIEVKHLYQNMYSSYYEYQEKS